MYAGTGVTIPRPTNIPTKSAIQALLARWLPVAAIRLEPATSGASTPVWAVSAHLRNGRNETFYLRLGEEPGERRDGEVRIHQLLLARGLPVPEIIAWEGLPPELDRAATLTRAIPGMALSEAASMLAPQAIAAVARQAGRDLARVNAFPVVGYGWIDIPDASTGSLRAECPTRGAWLAEYAAAFREVAAANLLAPHLLPALHAAWERWRDEVPATNSAAWLAHGDFDASHIFCIPSESGEEATYTGFIDFGEARGAGPLYDLGHALMHDGDGETPSIFPSLFAGYCAESPLPENAWDLVRIQAIAIGVRRLSIAHRRGNPHAREVATRISRLLTTDTSNT